MGKGRKERVAPLTRATVAVLRVWLRERQGQPADPLFPSRAGRRLTRDAVERRLSQHVSVAQRTCSTLRAKRVTMHVLRHTTAMTLLQAGIDTATIALWLGHEQERTTRVYLHADLELKQRVLDRTTPVNARPGRYLAPDTLLAFLDGLYRKRYADPARGAHRILRGLSREGRHDRGVGIKRPMPTSALDVVAREPRALQAEHDPGLAQ